METQGVQEGGETLHEDEDDHAEDGKRGKDDEEEQGSLP